MGNWFGHIIAIFVAGVVLFIIASVNIRVQQSAISSVQYRAGKTETMDLMSLMDRDFRNIGSNYPNFDLPIDSAITGLDTTASPKFFEFRGQKEPGLAPQTIRYEWSEIGTVVVRDTVRTAYQVKRYVDGALSASSGGKVTRFDIGLLTSDGMPIASPADARQIAVKLSLVSGLGKSSAIEQTDWNTIIRPIALAKDDF